jgi:uncharacterized SAM-binding protein YcdF (DUF218 family)
VPAPASRQGRRFHVIVAVSAILVLAAGVFGFLGIGRFMAGEDPLDRADAIFVLAGTRAERPLEAADLFRDGYAPRIVVTRAPVEQAVFYVEQRGITVATDFDLTKEILVQLGVPESALIAPARIHDNTAEEAQTLRELAVQRQWRRVIVVTSKYHLRRAGLASRRALRGTDVQLLMRGSRYDASTPARWWTRRSDIRWLVSEVPKLVAYTLGLGT